MKQNILMLHGAIGSSVQLEPLAELLTDTFKVNLLNFSGHGGKPVTEEIFSIEMFAKDVLYFIDKGRLEGINIYGYSMGGYVALYIARHYPGKINKIFTTATKFNWNEDTSLKESKFLNPE
ncbi:MAG: alpha/beta fold hydrolase, partial [Ignavibacteria bacterium]